MSVTMHKQRSQKIIAPQEEQGLPQDKDEEVSTSTIPLEKVNDKNTSYKTAA